MQKDSCQSIRRFLFIHKYSNGGKSKVVRRGGKHGLFLPEKNSIRNWEYDVGECNKSDVFYYGPGSMATIEL